MKKHVLCITIGCLFGCLLIGAAATPAHAEISALNKRQGVSATERDVRVDDKPLYFVHLRGVALAMHARENLAATEAFSEGRLQVNAPANRQYTQLLEARQHDVLAQIQQLSGSAPRVLARHTLALNALVLAMDGRDAERIAALPDVVRVERIYRSQLHTDRGPAHIGAIDAWDGVGTLPGNQGEGVIVGIIDTGIRTDHPAFADIGGDGYDHTNPLGAGNYLGDCIRNARLCNDKLIGVVSYPEITDSYGGLRPANGTDYNGHGTHVASTAAGNILNNVAILDDAGGNSYRIPRVSGVAPHANIVAYQVCFPANGGCLPQLAVKAVEHAIANGVDVINYSVGSEAFSPWESAAAMAFLSARAAGIHVATSAGNFGPDPSTLGTPANAPWITSVAAYTHDRDYTLPSLTGFIGGTPPRAALQGKGVTNEYTGTVVLASGYRDALCSTPFPRGTFNGEIVVCERGVIPRVDKGRNVLAGGAGGMILINTRNTDDETFADFHVLPALHLDSASAATLLAWLQSGGQTATITAAGPVSNSVLADIAGNFSSRGPALPFGNLPGPDVAAPGVDILAAWIRDVPFTPGNLVADFAFLNGTSMSSPHVAGVLALLTGMHPDWMPAEMQSALITTAESNTLSNRERSTTFDHGGGRIDVPAAALAGLVMDVAEAEYLAADPAAGGDPAALNQPILIQESCMLECEWTRTVKAVVNGTWNASATAATGLVISVEPATFTLAAGERQALTIRATLAEGGGTVWRHGRVALMQTGIGAVSPTEMPVSVRLQSGAAPAFVTLEARADAGSAPLNGFRSIGTDSLQIRADGLSKAALYEAFLSQDPTPDAPVDVLDGVVQVVSVATHSGTRALVVEILEADASDLDLFIARDIDYDGKPNGAELLQGELCTSAIEHAMERCIVLDPPPGMYWIAVQNFTASAPGTTDRHLLSVATIEEGNTGLTVTGPGSIDNGETYALQAAWNVDMQRGDRHYAMLSVGTDAATPDNIGKSILRVDRVADPVTVRVDKTRVSGSDTVTYTWEVPGVEGVTTRTLLLETKLPENVSVNADAGAERDGNILRWSFTQAPGAGATTGHVTLGLEPDSGSREIALAFTLVIDGESAAAVPAPKVEVVDPPVARINGSASATLQAEPGQLLKIDTTASRPSQEGETLEYQWKQTGGPAALPESAGGGLFDLRVPEGSAGEVLKYRLVVTSGGIASEPANLAVKVSTAAAVPLPTGGGGASAFGLLLLAAFRWRRKR